MNKTKFYEALYASCSDVVAHRKSVVLPLIAIIMGVALTLISTLLLKEAELEDISSSLILAGIALIVGGGIWAAGRFMGSGEPYNTKQDKFLTTRILSFDRARRSEVLGAIRSGDVNRLLAIPTCDVSALCVMISHLPDNSFAAAQAFEYAELEYKELCRVTLLNGAKN